MKHLLLYLCGFLISFQVSGAHLSVDAVRAAFVQSANDEDKTEQLLSDLSGNLSDPLLIAYRAGTEALMGKFSSIPWTKYSYCKQAMKSFQDAVSKDPSNIEIRYLRIAVQANLPSFLNMSENIEEDKKVIIQNIQTSSDISLNKKIAALLLDKVSCSEAEKSILRKY